MSTSHDELVEVFRNLDHQIDRLSRRIEARRNYVEQAAPEEHRSRKCTLICQSVENGGVECVQKCVKAVVPLASLDELAPHYPHDVARLRGNAELRAYVERHQHVPHTIQNTDAEAVRIADVYAMPIATIILPEEAWDRSMTCVQQHEHRKHLETLVRNWVHRSRDYPEEAREELARKLYRHDSGGVLKQAIQEQTGQ